MADDTLQKLSKERLQELYWDFFRRFLQSEYAPYVGMMICQLLIKEGVAPEDRSLLAERQREEVKHFYLEALSQLLAPDFGLSVERTRILVEKVAKALDWEPII